MLTGNGSKTARAERATSKARTMTNKSAVRSRALAPAATLTESPSSAVDAVFREDDKMQAVLRKHIGTRAKDLQLVSQRAREAFANFKPSMFAPAQRELRSYLAPGGDLAQSMRDVAEKGVVAMRESAVHRTLKIHIGDELTNLVTHAPGGGPHGAVPLQDLINFFRDKLGDVPTLRNDPMRTACEAEAKANEVLSRIEGRNNGARPGVPTTLPVVTSGPGENDDASRTRPFVRKHVHELLAKVTPPEEQLRFDTEEERAKLGDTETNVESFQLRAGASDVISYHDFNVLQIAFEHVWTEIFDSRLKSLGTQLYHEAAQLETFSRANGTTNLNFAITSIPDLLDFLRTIRELGQTTTQAGQTATQAGQTTTEARPDYLPVLGEDGVARQVIDIPGASRLSRLLDEIDLILKHRYAFHVFAKDSYNFGIMVTYRQTWKPERYQVGDLVSTIPLAPRETRRYTTKQVVKKTRAVKTVEESLRNTKSDSSGTSRVEREIIDKAQQKTNFDLTTHGSFGGEGYQADVTAKAGGEQASQSEKAKKHFHEAVLKSAQDYRQQNRMEIDTTTSEETEQTTYHEIQNPNDELTVTYMFYELERTYRISEKIHQLTPVILVANEMPAPDAIDDAWLIRHDWILRRVILDDSFKPALEYLTKSFVGAEINIRILENNAKAQKHTVDEVKEQIKTQRELLENDERNLANTVKRHANAIEIQGGFNSIKRIFDPIGITGEVGEGAIAAGETMVDYLQETFDRAEREKARLLDQLGVATTALQAAIDKLSAATKEHYDRIAEIDRLRINVKENILYYMQAIWSHEPPDQRFFRIYNLDVELVEPDTNGVTVPLNPLRPNIVDALQGRKPAGVTLPIPPVNRIKKKLVEVADLDTVLGYKGNYAIYALNENNYVTLHMMQDYLEVSDAVKLRDPDDFGNYTVDDLQKLAACMRRDDRDGFEDYRDQFKELIIKRLMSGRAEDDRVIVPTTSLYVEALVGTHPLLEDFKLIHRALDVKKVQAEVRHAELENIRLAARALKGKDEDPDVEKKIVIESDNSGITVQPE